MSDGAARRGARGRGLEAEYLAGVYLAATGWRVLARGFAASGGEIDLIVRRGDMIAFVEVKARSTREAALRAIDAGKTRRISAAARAWIARNPAHAGRNFRGDALLLAPWRLPRRVPDAFPLDLRGF